MDTIKEEIPLYHCIKYINYILYFAYSLTFIIKFVPEKWQKSEFALDTLLCNWN